MDQNADGWLGAFWMDEAGTINLMVVRNASGQITSVETISNEKAQDLLTKSEQQAQSSMDGLDKKIESKMKELFPDS